MSVEVMEMEIQKDRECTWAKTDAEACDAQAKNGLLHKQNLCLLSGPALHTCSTHH